MRRLVMHCGPAKTGTSAVQNLAFLNRDRLLREFGVLYPDSVRNQREPRHVFLQEELIRDLKFQGLRRALDDADRTCARTVVISSEGLTSQSYLFDRARTSEFRDVTRDWQVEFIFVTREKTAWLTSRYRQHVINQPQPQRNDTLERLHATGLPFSEWTQNEELHHQIDHEVLSDRFQSLFGPVPIKFIEYGPTVVNDVLAAIGIDKDIAPDDLPFINTTPPDSYIEVLRRINRLRYGLRLNNAAGAAIRNAVDSNNVQLSLRREPEKAALILLAATLCTLQWSPNPPLDVTARSFEEARLHIAKTALQMSVGRRQF